MAAINPCALSCPAYFPKLPNFFPPCFPNFSIRYFSLFPIIAPFLTLAAVSLLASQPCSPPEGVGPTRAGHSVLIEGGAGDASQYPDGQRWTHHCWQEIKPIDIFFLFPGFFVFLRFNIVAIITDLHFYLQFRIFLLKITAQPSSNECSPDFN